MARNIPIMKSKGLQPRLLYPARLSTNLEGKIRASPDEIRLKENTSTEPALQDMLKGLLKKMKKKSGERGTQVQMGKMNKYLSIIILNVNGLNAPMKRQRVAEGIRKYDLHICCLQRTYTD